MSDNEVNEEGLSRQVPIEWYVPESVVSGYATNMTLQRTEHEFILSFYEQRLPILLGVPQESFSQIESVRAFCFARVTIASARFPGFMEVLQRALREATETGEEGEEQP